MAEKMWCKMGRVKMNKWQQAYSELKAMEDTLKQTRYVSNVLNLIVSVLLMLVEDKLNEKA